MEIHPDPGDDVRADSSGPGSSSPGNPGYDCDGRPVCDTQARFSLQRARATMRLRCAIGARRCSCRFCTPRCNSTGVRADSSSPPRRTSVTPGQFRLEPFRLNPVLALTGYALTTSIPAKYRFRKWFKASLSRSQATHGTSLGGDSSLPRRRRNRDDFCPRSRPI